MNSFLKITPVLVYLFLTACGPSEEKAKNTSMPEADTLTEAPGSHTSETSLDYFGTYTGTIPCASCPGIATKLTLNENQTFVLERKYLDEESPAFIEKGKYFVKDNIAYIKNAEDTSFYALAENKLYMLDKEKQKITGALADAYILHKKMTRTSQKGFPGSYTTQAPNTGFSQTLEITAVGEGSYKVAFSAPEINGEPACSFVGTGKTANDTLKIALTELEEPATMVLVKRDNQTVEVFMAEEKDTHALMYFCSGGASLAGSYRTLESYGE